MPNSTAYLARQQRAVKLASQNRAHATVIRTQGQRNQANRELIAGRALNLALNGQTAHPR